MKKIILILPLLFGIFAATSCGNSERSIKTDNTIANTAKIAAAAVPPPPTCTTCSVACYLVHINYHSIGGGEFAESVYTNAAGILNPPPIRAKLGKSLGGIPALGYKWENNQLVVDEQYAPLRKLVYELFLKHKRKKTVATVLNEQGYRSRSGKKFTDMAVHYLLRDSTAKGERRANYLKKKGTTMVFKPVEEWVITSCPAIISAEVWNECNRLLDESEKKHKRVGPKAKHLLAGFVECDCGTKMYVFHKQLKEPAFICKKCHNKIAETDINDIYKEQLREFLLADSDLDSYNQKLDVQLLEKIQLLQLVLDEKANLKKTIDGLVKMRANGEMDKEMFKEQYSPLEGRYIALSEQVPELQSAVDILTVQSKSSAIVLHDAKDLYSKWDILDFEDKRHIVELITNKIIVSREDIEIKLSYLPTRSNKANPPAHQKPNISNSENSGNSLNNSPVIRRGARAVDNVHSKRAGWFTRAVCIMRFNHPVLCLLPVGIIHPS